MKLKTLRDIELEGKKVVLRADLNVPLTDDGKILDDSRIKASLPSIKYILSHGGSVILMSHLGRPGGKREEKFTLAPIAKRLTELLNMPITFAPDCVGGAVDKLISRMEPGSVTLLENTRFHEGEESPEKEPDFAKKLGSLGDVYVNDAFGTLHRKHASTYFITDFYENAACGFLVEKEVLILSNLLTQAGHPFYAIIGGSKIASKIGVLQALIGKVDGLFIGGGMAFTFFKALNYNIGNSLVDEPHIETAKQIMKKCKTQGVDLYLPKDIAITKSLSKGSKREEIFIEDGIPEDFLGADIGEKTLSEWETALAGANTIFWNGPVGVYELPPFQKGTHGIANALANTKAMTIIGGGDSGAAVYNLGLDQKITCISTGGGATLEFIEFGTLPLLEKLSQE